MKISEAAKINHDIAMIHAGHDGMPNGLRYIEKLLRKHDSETRELTALLKEAKKCIDNRLGQPYQQQLHDRIDAALSKAGAE